jgi:hypothetical protein
MNLTIKKINEYRYNKKKIENRMRKIENILKDCNPYFWFGDYDILYIIKYWNKFIDE